MSEFWLPRYELVLDIGERKRSIFLPLGEAACRYDGSHVNVVFGRKVLVAPDEFRPMTPDDKSEISANAPIWPE